MLYNFLQQVLRYVAGSFNLGLTFCKDSAKDLIRYLDSDYVCLINQKKPIKSLCFQICSGCNFSIIKTTTHCLSIKVWGGVCLD